MTDPLPVYDPTVFEVPNLDAAMRIILTPEGATTRHRWVTETPYIADLVHSAFPLTEHSLVLDYGCGVGRLAKELIDRHGCRVVGVDISEGMRTLAVTYVGSDRFFACAPAALDVLVDRDMAFDIALSIWVLQHCAVPADDIGRIARAVKPNGGLFVVNQVARSVPTNEGWVDDQLDIPALLSAKFTAEASDAMNAEATSAFVSHHTYWATYRR